MRKDFPSIRSHPDSRLGENRSSEKDKAVKVSAIQNYINKPDTAYATHITDPKKELSFKMPQPKGTCPPSAIKTTPGSSTPDRSSIPNESKMTNLSSLLSTGIKVNKPYFPTESASYSNANQSPNSGSLYGLGSKTEVCNQFAQMNQSLSNFNISPQTTQPARQPILPSYTQPTHSPKQQTATTYQNPFLKATSNQSEQVSLHSLINKNHSPQQTLLKPQEMSLGQRPANNIFGVFTPPPSNQPKSGNIFMPNSAPQTQKTSNIYNTLQQTSFNNSSATTNSLDQYSK